MIELEFWPDISREEIRLASRTQKGEEYPESVYEEKSRLEARSRRTKWIAITILSLFALLTGISLISMVLQPESYRDLTVTLVVVEGTVYLICAAIIFGLLVSLEGAGKPAPLEARVSTFYSGLGLSPLESFARSYFIVAPHAMERLSQQKFINSWKSVKEDINRKVSHQEAVNCAHCGTKSEGMWIKDRVILEDDFQAGKKLFIQCPECNSEYCWKCYIGFTDGHQCPKCEKKLKEKGWLAPKEALRIFMINPEVTGVGTVKETDIRQEDERGADTYCCIEVTFTGTSLVDDSVTNVDLGARGKLVCKFHNKAVKIGNDWRLLSATAGKRTQL